MKRLVAIFLSCIFAASVCGVAFANEKWEGKGEEKTMEQRHQEKLEKMTKELNLTPDQKDKISALMKDKGDKMMAEKKKMDENAKAIMDEYNTQVKAVLTPEQAAKYDKMMEEHKAKMEEHKTKMEKKMKKHHEKAEAEAPAPAK